MFNVAFTTDGKCEQKMAPGIWATGPHSHTFPSIWNKSVKELGMTRQNYSHNATASSTSKSKFKLIVALLLAGLILCLVGIVLLRILPWPPQTIAERPSTPLVLIHAPIHGSQIDISQPLIIQASAHDANNITRIELWIDGQLKIAQTRSDGITPFPLVATWQKPTTGLHTLTVRAFNSLGTRASASIQIEGVKKPDGDGDGVIDDLDNCPDIPAPSAPDGCPQQNDRDGDGVADEEDSCPDEAGWADHEGCPTPGDRDGDGVTDVEDACPDVPGEMDVEGCPDRDGDSVPDAIDEAPDEPGPADLHGAPDRDGDSVPDARDLLPEEPGPPESGGAPSGPDRDGDGASDDADPCPDEAGMPEDDFCPPPSEDPVPEEPESGDFPFGLGPGPRGELPTMPVEVEAYYFSESNDYDDLWCYVQLADNPWESHRFSPEGVRQWNIREHLGGENSVHLAIRPNEALQVALECWGINPGGHLVYLGTYQYAHPLSDWNGHELIATATGEDDSRFVGKYRICSPTCEETAMPAPVLQTMTLGPYGDGPYKLLWSWDGNEDWIDGFVLDINGAIQGSAGVIFDPSAREMDISDLIPMCGEASRFRVRAFRGAPPPADWSLTPPSNSIAWTNSHCPRTVAVTFDTLETPPHVCDPHCGPLQGRFYANDTTLLPENGRSDVLSFDTTGHGYGAYIYPDRVTSIADMFEAIEQDVANSGIGGRWDEDTYAPSTNILTVELGPRQSLTIGASIYDSDEPGSWDSGDRWIFDNSITIPHEAIHPGEYVIGSRGIHMRVQVDVLVGPEAGGPDHLPDLTITDVTTHEESGQLQVHLFNNAAALSHQDVDIALINQDSDETVTTLHWSDISIAPGESIILQTHEQIEPYNLRFILDPENAIAETNEDNNIYETPIRMHVQFTKLRWGDPCESFLTPGQVAEYYFRINIGHRSPDGETTWIAQRRYPWSGNITVDWTDWTTEDDWVLEDDADFDFQFDMPPDHKLVIYAEGYEDDPGVSMDDYAGRVDQSFGRDVNYGDSDDEYHFTSTDWHDCHDGTPLGWDINNFHIWWRIERIH